MRAAIYSLGFMLAFTSLATAQDPAMLNLHLRSRTGGMNAEAKSEIVEKKVVWDPLKTAFIVCDMWDAHWCQGAADRVVELAGPMNRMIGKARDKGCLIIHAPSSCMDFYKDSPARLIALSAPYSKPPIELSKLERWGTAWCYPDPQREPAIPIDDSDMGCDCAKKCAQGHPWKREIDTLKIDTGDALTDNGQETWNLLTAQGIDNVVLCGVHLNMCVLGRPFAIRQMVKLGKNVALVRDMTDTMYNHEMSPHVSHFEGTDLMIGHVERYWCPTFTSSDLTGDPPFRFKEDPRGK
ncbi:MAG: cysteine hydrolase family protein [Planctomycetes bacterium]|nr:cysteine hydrolase family protein [Planctomycetota bacterium]